MGVADFIQPFPLRLEALDSTILGIFGKLIQLNSSVRVKKTCPTQVPFYMIILASMVSFRVMDSHS